MFVQVVNFRTSKIDEIRKQTDAMLAQRDPDFTASRGLLCEDRDNPGRYFNIVFFDSFESAMKNSELPVTQEFAGKVAALADGPPTFFNLNVLDDRSL